MTSTKTVRVQPAFVPSEDNQGAALLIVSQIALDALRRGDGLPEFE